MMKVSFALIAAAASSFLPVAFGHGYVSEIVLDGVTYKGPKPGFSTKAKTPIRQTYNTNPLHLTAKGDLSCGRGASKRGASMTAKVTAGSTVTYRWNSGDPNPNWPHNSGAEMEYLAPCDPAGCDKTDTSKIKFFKIAQIGKTKDNVNEWYQNTLLHKGKSMSFVIPKEVPNGKYILSHLLISLHLADLETDMNNAYDAKGQDKDGGAEFYPSCWQIEVIGGTSGPVPDGVLAKDMYTPKMKGVLINIWNDAKKPYPYPGPELAKFNGKAVSTGKTGSTGSSVADTGAATADDSPSTDVEDEGSTDADDGSDEGADEDEDCTEEDDPEDTPAPAPKKSSDKKASDKKGSSATTTTKKGASTTTTKAKSEKPTSPAYARRSRHHSQRHSH